MKKLALIIALVLTQSAALAQSTQPLSGSATLDKFRELNNAGTDLINSDYAAAAIKFQQAYNIAAQANDQYRMKVSQDNLALARRLQARNKSDMIMTQAEYNARAIVQQPFQYSSQPCNGCQALLLDAQHRNSLEIMNTQNAFDRQTFREDHDWASQYQRAALEQQSRARQDYMTQMQEQAYMNDQAERTRRNEGTSYFSRFTGSSFGNRR